MAAFFLKMAALGYFRNFSVSNLIKVLDLLIFAGDPTRINLIWFQLNYIISLHTLHHNQIELGHFFLFLVQFLRVIYHWQARNMLFSRAVINRMGYICNPTAFFKFNCSQYLNGWMDFYVSPLKRANS